MSLLVNVMVMIWFHYCHGIINEILKGKKVIWEALQQVASSSQ